ncbi:hypothetical protein [Kitasatospora sp. GP82]|uniref:hypothetical protein n=1 Tax=Kitasatospora sp. GP82 TaxID=3035089 RepID=UPI0024758C55|nr:hypothetical protein [Kitasatospora sp. GP82]MDH6129836.1 hypothetical protein [Kitasatospora sp. GP82]
MSAHRRLFTAAALAATTVLTLTAFSGPASAAGSAARSSGHDVALCGNSESESDIAPKMIGLNKSADGRWTGVIKLTNTSRQNCVMYGPADLRTDHTSGEFTRLTTGVLGDGIFSTDRAHGTVVPVGHSVYQPVTWLSSPPIAPNASCTTGNLLVLFRNEGVLALPIPVFKDARFCPSGEIGSPQVLIGVPKTTLADAQAQLHGLDAA